LNLNIYFEYNTTNLFIQLIEYYLFNVCFYCVTVHNCIYKDNSSMMDATDSLHDFSNTGDRIDKFECNI